MVVTILLQIITPVISSLASVIAVQVIGFLVQHLGVKKLQRVQQLMEQHKAVIKDVVKFVQQRYAQCDGSTKLQIAMDKASQQLSHYGLNLPADQIEVAIEASLKTLKLQFGEQWDSAVETPTITPEPPQE